MRRDVRVLGIESFVKHFSWYCGHPKFFFVFLSCHITLILESCTMFSK